MLCTLEPENERGRPLPTEPGLGTGTTAEPCNDAGSGGTGGGISAEPDPEPLPLRLVVDAGAEAFPGLEAHGKLWCSEPERVSGELLTLLAALEGTADVDWRLRALGLLLLFLRVRTPLWNVASESSPSASVKSTSWSGED